MTLKGQIGLVVGGMIALLLCSTGLFFATTIAIGGEQATAGPDRVEPLVSMSGNTIVKIVGIIAGAIGTWSIILLTAIKWLIGRSVNSFDQRFDRLENTLEQERNRIHDTEVDLAALDGRFVRKEDCNRAHSNLQKRIDSKCNGVSKNK